MKKKSQPVPAQYRQGDVMIERVNRIPDNAKARAETHRLTLALGEVTGHSHVLEADVIAPYDAGAVFFALRGEIHLRHQEHGTIRVPEGTYELVRQREYTPSEIRTVAD
jgi:hypothetical protein